MTNITISNKKQIIDLFSEEQLVEIKKHEDLNIYLTQAPPEKWVKTNKFANNSKYLPIDKVEWLLRKLFKMVSIEILNQGTAFNGVWVSVRVHYMHPVTNKMEFHDGIGACELQVKKDSSPADLANINKNALAMAFPIAKSYAIKDACHHFGDAFGANLNRQDVLPLTPDNNPVSNYDTLVELFNLKRDNLDAETIQMVERVINTKEVKSYNKAIEILKAS